MKELIEGWQIFFGNDDLADRVKSFLNASSEDKLCIIQDTYGIFDGSIKGNVYTYYWHTCEEHLADLYGKFGKARYNLWRKVLKCYRVDYNFVTDEISCKRVRFNKRCTENASRKL